MALRLPPRGAGLRYRGAGEPGYTSMKLPGAFVLNRKARVGTTTGTVPAGIPKRVTKRTFRCTITLQEATWTLTTLGYAGAEVVAEGSRRVVVR